MNYNIANFGKAVALEYNPEGLRPIYITDNQSVPQRKQEFTPYPHIPLPYPDLSRHIMFVCAPSQSGKTTFVSLYADWFCTYLKVPEIVVFSEKAADQLDEITSAKVKRIKLDEKVTEKAIDPLQFANKLIIFDDIDGIYDKKIRSEIFQLIERILKLGGEYKIHIIITYHMLTNYKETRYLLFEANYVVIFPNTGSESQFVNLFKNYIGIDLKKMKSILSTNSRWALIHKNHPKYIVYNNGVEILT